MPIDLFTLLQMQRQMQQQQMQQQQQQQQHRKTNPTNPPVPPGASSVQEYFPLFVTLVVRLLVPVKEFDLATARW
jgi:hypothetical protein